MIINIPEENKIIKNLEWEPNGINALKNGDTFSIYASDWKVLHYIMTNEDKSYPINSKWIFRKIISPTELEVDWLCTPKY